MRYLVAGSSGLVGSALVESLEKAEKQVVGISSKDVDLSDNVATLNWFKEQGKFDVVIDAAAKVGGIVANNSNPVEFLSKNLQIQQNLMYACHLYSVNQFIFLGSSCIYPRNAMQPIREDYLMTGELEETNSAYAIAKIAGIELVKSYRKEFGKKWISLMPTNIYGPKDNFSLNSSHVLPAFIRKFSDAKFEGAKTITLWGTGKPKREFLHSEDLASAVIFALENYDGEQHLNIGTGQEISIKDLAEMVASIIGFNGEIIWDDSKPDGTPRKLLDSSKINALGWSHKISLIDGVSKTIDWYNKALSKGEIRL